MFCSGVCKSTNSPGIATSCSYTPQSIVGSHHSAEMQRVGFEKAKGVPEVEAASTCPRDMATGPNTPSGGCENVPPNADINGAGVEASGRIGVNLQPATRTDPLLPEPKPRPKIFILPYHRDQSTDLNPTTSLPVAAHSTGCEPVSKPNCRPSHSSQSHLSFGQVCTSSALKRFEHVHIVRVLESHL